MQGDSTLGQLTDSDWATFMAKLEAAEHEFVQGRPAAFKALWSHSDDVSICGAFGGRGVRVGQGGIPARLGEFAVFTRHPRREEIRSAVGADFAYIVQIEHIRFRSWPDGRIDPRTAGNDGVSQRSLIPFKKSTQERNYRAPASLSAPRRIELSDVSCISHRIWSTENSVQS